MQLGEISEARVLRSSINRVIIFSFQGTKIRQESEKKKPAFGITEIPDEDWFCRFFQ
jgi:hypothetical protein